MTLLSAEDSHAALVAAARQGKISRAVPGRLVATDGAAAATRLAPIRTSSPEQSLSAAPQQSIERSFEWAAQPVVWASHERSMQNGDRSGNGAVEGSLSSSSRNVNTSGSLLDFLKDLSHAQQAFSGDVAQAEPQQRSVSSEPVYIHENSAAPPMHGHENGLQSTALEHEARNCNGHCQAACASAFTGISSSGMLPAQQSCSPGASWDLAAPRHSHDADDAMSVQSWNGSGSCNLAAGTVDGPARNAIAAGAHPERSAASDSSMLLTPASGADLATAAARSISAEWYARSGNSPTWISKPGSARWLRQRNAGAGLAGGSGPIRRRGRKGSVSTFWDASAQSAAADNGLNWQSQPASPASGWHSIFAQRLQLGDATPQSLAGDSAAAAAESKSVQFMLQHSGSIDDAGHWEHDLSGLITGRLLSGAGTQHDGHAGQTSAAHAHLQQNGHAGSLDAASSPANGSRHQPIGAASGSIPSAQISNLFGKDLSGARDLLRAFNEQLEINQSHSSSSTAKMDAPAPDACIELR